VWSILSTSQSSGHELSVAVIFEGLDGTLLEGDDKLPVFEGDTKEPLPSGGGFVNVPKEIPLLLKFFHNYGGICL
jgi:hypothetical protein